MTRKLRRTPCGPCPPGVVLRWRTLCGPRSWAFIFVLLTGNPGVGVTNTAIEQTLRRFKEAVGDSIVLAAGKMHAAGILSGGGGKHFTTEQDIASFVEAGADIILLPAPGTVPGITRRSTPNA